MRTLGIDIGTTSISFVVADTGSGELVRAVTLPNDSFIRTETDWEKLQNPERILAVVTEELEVLQQEYEIGYIGMTGQMHGIVYTDERGAAVSPLYTWQDSRGDQKMPDGVTYARSLSQLTGYAMATGFGGTTYYVHACRGRVPEGAAAFCTIADYIGMQLTGRREPLIDASNAASLGLFDLKKCRFDEKAILNADLDPGMFPAVAGQHRTIGKTKSGISVGVPVGDNQASFMGAVDRSEWQQAVLVNVGTGSQISFVLPHYEKLKDMEVRPFAEGQYLAVAAPLCGGRAYALLEKFFEQVIRGYAGSQNEAAAVSPNRVYQWMGEMLEENQNADEELIIKPLFSGTREEPDKRGRIKNIGTDNFTPQSMTYGMLAGIVDELYDYYKECDKSLTGHLKVLAGSGNGLRKNKYLQRMLEEKFGMPMKLARAEEEAAYGAAMNVPEE